MATTVWNFSRHVLKGWKIWVIPRETSRSLSNTLAVCSFKGTGKNIPTSSVVCNKYPAVNASCTQHSTATTLAFFSTASALGSGTSKATESDTPIGKVKLVDNNGADLGTVTESEAQIIAKEKDLKLVILDKDSNPMPTYGLMTAKQISEEKLKQKESKGEGKAKSSKTVKIGSKITQHDIGIKLKNVQDWLEKGHKINVLIKNVDKNTKGINDVFHAITTATTEKAVIESAKSTQKDIFFVLKPKSMLPSGKPSKLKPLTMEQLKKLRTVPEES